MIEPVERASLDDFKRHTAESIERLKETGQPQVLTVDGKAAVVVQDVASYWNLLDRLDRAEALEGIRRGIEAAARGEEQPIDEAFDELRAELGLPKEG